MSIALIYKWGRSPDEAFVYDDGSHKLLRDRLVASDDDAAAVVCAREYAAATGCELCAVTVGSGDASWAAARGAARLACAADVMPGLDNTATAEGIAGAVQASGTYDIVVMGDAADSAGVASIVAAKLGMPFVGGVQDFAVDPNDTGSLIAHRRSDKTMQTLRITLPAFIGVAATEQEKQIPAIKQMLAAKKVPVDALTVTAPDDSKVSIASARCPEIHRAKIFEGDTAQAVAALVETLRADEALPAGM